MKNFERFLQNLNNNQTTTGTHDSKISSVVFSSSKHKEIKVIFVFIPYFIGLLSKKVLPKLGDSEKRYKVWASHVEGFSKEGRLKPSSHYIHRNNIKISCLRNWIGWHKRCNRIQDVDASHIIDQNDSEHKDEFQHRKWIK